MLKGPQTCYELSPEFFFNVLDRKNDVIKTSRDMPQQLAVGLSIHQSIRSEGLVNMLHGFAMSVEYKRLLKVDSQIEASVLKRME